MPSKKISHEIIENSKNPVLFFDDNAHLVDVSNSVLSSWGYDKEVIRGEKFYDIVHEEDRERLVKFLLMSLNENQIDSEDFRVLKANGEIIELSGSTYVLREEKNGHDLLVLNTVDITEHKNLKDLLVSASAEWRQMFDSIKDIIILLEDDRVKRANLQLAHILNRDIEDILGKKCCDVMADLDKPVPGCPYVRTLKSGIEETLEWYNSNLDMFLSCSAYPVRLEQGNLIGPVIIIRDITEQKKLEEELKVSEERYKTLIENIEDIIYVTDATRRLKYFNNSFERSTGYSQEEIIGKNLAELFSGKSLDGVETVWKKQISGEDVGIFNMEISTKGGEKKIIETRERVLWDKGKIVLIYGLGRDVTRRKVLEEHLIQSEKLASMGEMLSGVAHEINNPLTSIIGNSQLLMRKSDLDHDVMRKVDTIQKESARVHRIVQNLLSFARKEETRKEMANINGIIKDVCDLIIYNVKVNNIKINLDLEDDLTQTYIDSNQIKQVFINIINNAIDALIDKGGGNIEIKSFKVGDTIRVEFKDDGPGIPDTIRKKIFDPFFTTKDVGKGTGLGLSISYGIIKNHNGEIYVTSEKGVGTKFTVSLPIVVSDSIESQSQSKKGKLDLKGKKILMVDDEESIRNFVDELLTGEGCIVEVVDNGAEAMEKLAKGDFDAILCDIKMPGVSGKELFDFIKENKPKLVDKIVFITGDLLSEDTEKFMKETGSSFIEKPLQIDSLIEVVQNLFKDEL
jgi:PAS domain S-box-containing protein